MVANALRLLKLPPAVQNYIREGRLSVGHAKVILGIADEKKLKLAAERVIKEGLNVRQTEGLVARLKARDSRPPGLKPEQVAAPGADPQVADMEDRLREKFGTGPAPLAKAKARWKFRFTVTGSWSEFCKLLVSVRNNRPAAYHAPTTRSPVFLLWLRCFAAVKLSEP